MENNKVYKHKVVPIKKAIEQAENLLKHLYFSRDHKTKFVIWRFEGTPENSFVGLANDISKSDWGQKSINPYADEEIH